jgi:uncharacterized protein (DUF952 family)
MIYHITSTDAWKNAQQKSQYLPEGFEKEGFIHCSNKDQIVGVGQRYYAGQSGLLILGINTDKLDARVVFENLVGGEELFPHIYGALNLTAVESTASFEVGLDGTCEFPQIWMPA